MHVLEVIIYILAIGMLYIVMSKKVLKAQVIIPLLSVTGLVLILHIIFDHIRWQLFTLYVAILILGVMLYLTSIMSITLKRLLRRTLIIGLTVFIVISAVSAFVFPIYTLPTPNGDHLIGTESFVIEDENRIEQYSENSNEFRKIKIQLWYPAEVTKGYEQAPWLEDGLVVARALSKDMGLPSFVIDHTTNIMSNSYFDAPLSDALDDYPVIIISHGWRGFRNIHTDYAEELASMGYIVIGIDHAYGSVATVFSEDDIAYLNLDALPHSETTTDFLNYANQLVNTYASDVVTTLDYLEEMNSNTSSSRFSGKLDLTNIGLLGHSTGGGGDVAVALNDDRIDAVIGLDAWVEPIEESEIDKGLTIPSLFLRSGAWENGVNNTNLYALINNSAYAPLLYQIDGTTHYDFAMVYMYSPLIKVIGFSGSVENMYLNSILKSMISDFFDKTLKNDVNSEIDSDIWEEVRIISV